MKTYCQLFLVHCSQSEWHQGTVSFRLPGQFFLSEYWLCHKCQECLVPQSTAFWECLHCIHSQLCLRNFISCGGSHAKLSGVWAPELSMFGISSMSWNVVKQVFAGRSDGKLFNQFCRKQGRLKLSLVVLHAWALTCPFILVLMAPGLSMGYLLCLCHGVSCPACVDCLAGWVEWGPKKNFAVWVLLRKS